MNNINIVGKQNLIISGVSGVFTYICAKRRKKDIKHKAGYTILAILGVITTAFFLNRVAEDNFEPVEEEKSE